MYSFCTLKSLHTSATRSERELALQSDRSSLGAPCLQTTCSSNILAIVFGSLIRANASADTLSRIPTASVASVVAASEDLGAAQRVDPDFKLVCVYLDKGMLPDNDSKARKVVLNSESFDLTDGAFLS